MLLIYITRYSAGHVHFPSITIHFTSMKSVGSNICDICPGVICCSSIHDSNALQRDKSVVMVYLTLCQILRHKASDNVCIPLFCIFNC